MFATKGKEDLTKIVGESGQKKTKKEVFNVLLSASTASENVLGVEVADFSGGAAVVSRNLGQTKAFIGIYYSDKPSFPQQYFAGIKYDFNKMGGIKARYFVPEGKAPQHFVVDGYINLEEATLEAGYWKFMGNDYQFWVGSSVGGKFGENKHSPEFRARLLQMFDKQGPGPTIGQFKLDKQIGNGIKAGVELQIK